MLSLDGLVERRPPSCYVVIVNSLNKSERINMKMFNVLGVKFLRTASHRHALGLAWDDEWEVWLDCCMLHSG